MDIEELYTAEAHQTGAEMQLKDQTGKDIDCFITVAGMDSKLWRRSFSKHKSKLLSGKDNDSDCEMMADVTISWRGFQSGGADVEFSRDNVKALYINAPYIMSQVDLFVANRVNFTKS